MLQNLAPNTDDAIIDNFNAMLDLARLHGIKVVIASILPISFGLAAGSRTGAQGRAAQRPAQGFGGGTGRHLIGFLAPR